MSSLILIFENSEKKNREMKKERNKTYKRIKKRIKDEINQIQDGEEKDTENSNDEDLKKVW